MLISLSLSLKNCKFCFNFEARNDVIGGNDDKDINEDCEDDCDWDDVDGWDVEGWDVEGWGVEGWGVKRENTISILLTGLLLCCNCWSF